MRILKIAIIATVGLIVLAGALIWLFAHKSDIITEKEALEKVKALPEVQEFIALLSEDGKTASFLVEDRGDNWSAQVLEIVVRNGESHTATFNWYLVDKATGDISKEF